MILQKSEDSSIAVGAHPHRRIVMFFFAGLKAANLHGDHTEPTKSTPPYPTAEKTLFGSPEVNSPLPNELEQSMSSG
jgi:hypothetical protein